MGGLLVVAAAANLWRLSRWRGLRTTPEPLLLVLHLGYVWLVAGAALLGASLIDPRLPFDGAVHALTAGAIGTMILAVMTRATRGHTGRSLSADGLTRAIYALVVLAALVRIAASFDAAASMSLILAAATLWISAFALFAAAYAPMLLLRASPPG